MTPRRVVPPKTEKDWAKLWCQLNRWEIFPYNEIRCTLALGAMKLCEKFCTHKQRSEAWNNPSRRRKS